MKGQVKNAFCLGFLAVLLLGCGSDHPAITQSPKAEIDRNVQMRVIFDKVNGDASALSPADKATLVKLAGSQANVDSLWKIMSLNKRAPGAPPAQ